MGCPPEVLMSAGASGLVSLYTTAHASSADAAVTLVSRQGATVPSYEFEHIAGLVWEVQLSPKSLLYQIVPD